MEQADQDFRQANLAWAAHGDQLRRIAGVVAVGVCCNFEGTRRTNFRLKVFALPDHDTLPAEVDSIAIQVEEISQQWLSAFDPDSLEGHLTLIQSAAIYAGDEHALRWIAPHLEVCTTCREAHKALGPRLDPGQSD